jgi:hypothetical protein
VISLAGTAAIGAGLMLASTASAQNVDNIPGFELQDVPGFKVETKITPKRPFLMPWQTYGDDFEFNYSFNTPMPDFSSIVVGCQLLIAGDQNSPLTMFESIRRSDFKPSADGRFIATRGPTFIPRGGHTGANCQIRKIVK